MSGLDKLAAVVVALWFSAMVTFSLFTVGVVRVHVCTETMPVEGPIVGIKACETTTRLEWMGFHNERTD